MIVETKYNIGDEVQFFTPFGVPLLGRILGVYAEYTDKGVRIEYKIGKSADDALFAWREEDDICLAGRCTLKADDRVKIRAAAIDNRTARLDAIKDISFGLSARADYGRGLEQGFIDAMAQR
jgi:hypothetical protein